MQSPKTWLKLPHEDISVIGLPLTGGRPWQRLPAKYWERVPDAVAAQARFPAGGLLRFYSDAHTIALQLDALSEPSQQGIDVLADGQLWRTLSLAKDDSGELTLFKQAEPQWRLFEIYLPGDQQLELSAIGLNEGAGWRPAPLPGLPLIFCGSSILQGAGSHLASVNYPAILSRKLKLPVVNFGFYGAGRGEPEVLDAVLAETPRALIFDLGKSFGNQPASVYAEMLEQAHRTHPDAPQFCITPIYCLREAYDAGFAEFSDKLRKVVQEAAADRSYTTVIDGLSLLGPQDWAGFSHDGLHPNELGYTLIAERLLGYITEPQHNLVIP